MQRLLHHPGMHDPGRAIRLGCCFVAVQDEPSAVLQETEEVTEGLRQQILFAREYLKEVRIQDDQVIAATCTPPCTAPSGRGPADIA